MATTAMNVAQLSEVAAQTHDGMAMRNATTTEGVGTTTAEETTAVATTTTLSTIAVRAEPHSMVVVALLRSIGYVELRIDEMRPGLLQIGSNPQENAQLLLIHTDLHQRLLGKKQQVEELLGRAEKLVHEQTNTGDVLVYEAMADGLAATWKGLGRQLEMRGWLLTDTQHLYELAQKHEEFSKLLNSRLQQTEQRNKGDNEEMQRIIDELAELTHDGMDTGSNVIDQIRVLAALADNAERPREAFDACLDIEKIMLKMAQSWELLEGAWRKLKMAEKQAEQPEEHILALSSGNLAEKPATAVNYGAQLEASEQWISAAEQQFKQTRDGKMMAAEEQETLQQLVNEIKSQQVKLQALAEQIYAQGSALPPEMSNRCADLLGRHNTLAKEAHNRLDLLKSTQQWMSDTEALLIQLAKMRVELTEADGPMAAELGPLAQQKGVTLIERGEHLMAQWIGARSSNRKIVWEQIERRVQQLKESVIEVVQLAREKIAIGKAQKLMEKIDALKEWLHTAAEPFLWQPATLAPIANETSEFIQKHRNFSADLTNREQLFQSVASQRKFLGSKELEKLAAIEKRMMEVRELLERRLQLANKLEQLQKLKRELDTSFHFLSTLLQQDQKANNPEQQVRLLLSLNEHCIQEKHQSDGFHVLAASAADTDPHLNTDDAVKWSRAQVAAHQSHYALLNDECRGQGGERHKVVARKGVEQAGKAPTFELTFPSEKLIWEGQKLELVAKIESVPESRISWLKNGMELVERAGQCRIGWLNGMATLVIEEILPEDTGEYVLRAENPCGVAESRMQLVVEPATAQQYGNAENTTTTTNLFQTTTTTTKTTTITRTGGATTAADENANDQIVEELGECKPRFVKQLQNISVREGEQFLLDCVVLGNPEPKIIWSREEKAVRESERIHLSFKGDHCTLTCKNASGEDAGLYKVLAVNVHGETMNFCRVCIVPPSPTKRRKVQAPAPPPKPTTPIQDVGFISMQQQQQQPDASPAAPSIEPQLCSQMVREGQTVVFQTRVHGFPTPEVHWFYNGATITMNRSDLGLSQSADGRCTLTIPCVTLEHAGQYGIAASNTGGQASSNATLNVLMAIGLEDGMAIEQMAFDESDLLLGKQNFQTTKTMTTTRHETISKSEKESRNDFVLQQKQQLANGGLRQQQGSIDNRWTATEVSPSGPVYAVSKSEKAIRRQSSEGNAGYSSLANAPECLRPLPTELTIEEGEKAEVDCLMLGNPRPKAQWFFDDRPIKSNAVNFLEFSNIGDTYTIRFCPARLQHAGWYRLVVENIRGRCESLTLIHVRPKSMLPRPGAFGSHNQRARRSIGGVQGLMQWQRQQLLKQQQIRALSTPPHPLYATTEVPTPPPLLTRHAAKIEQQRMQPVMSMSAYEPREDKALMTTKREAFDFSADAQPLINGQSEQRIISTEQHFTEIAPGQPKGSPPHFIQTLASAVVSEGQSARFEAVVTGLPPPRLEWSKDGQQLSTNENMRIWMEGERAILQIEKASAQDAGKYCCAAENQSGMASSSAQLVLRSKTMAPDFVERLISQEVEEGTSLQWIVSTNGEPEPTVCWLRDGQPILGVEGVSLAKDAPFEYSLLIEQVQLTDAGQFTCILENIAGEARSTADLIIRPKGSAPGKYVHVTKVTQEKQVRGEELARNETVTIERQIENGEVIETMEQKNET